MSAEEIRLALRCGRRGCECARPRGPVHCPAHDDAHPSLSVDERDGRLLVHCFAGCQQEDVIEALRARGLWGGRPPAPALSRLRRGALEGPLVDVVRFIERYVKMPSEHATIAAALWVAHTHVFDAFDVTPYLIVQSPEKRSGKTRVLEVLELLCPRPWRVVQPSEAVLFRKIAKDRPVLLLDEADAIFKSRDQNTEPLRAVLNAGFRRGATVPRCAGKGTGLRVEEFSVFCPKAVAAIGDLPDTVEDRGIIIRLDRATPAEQRRLQRLRFRQAEAEAAPIREALAKWAERALPVLREARPALPEELDGRAADSWEPLLAVADQAGDGWSVVAWGAALALSTGTAREDDSLRVRLLADIRRVFDERGVDRLVTKDLIDGLAADETAPWGDWHGRLITPERIARLLRPFGVQPDKWREGSTTARGYSRDMFTAAWARYLPSSSLQEGFNPPHSPQPLIDAAGSLFFDPPHGGAVASPENDETPRQMASVAGVAGSTLSGGEGVGDGPLAAPEVLARGGGRGAFVLRIGAALSWEPYPYAPGRAIAAGKAAWVTFVRNAPEAEFAAAVQAMLTDPELDRGAGGGV